MRAISTANNFCIQQYAYKLTIIPINTKFTIFFIYRISLDRYLFRFKRIPLNPKKKKNNYKTQNVVPIIIIPGKNRRAKRCIKGLRTYTSFIHV